MKSNAEVGGRHSLMIRERIATIESEVDQWRLGEGLQHTLGMLYVMQGGRLQHTLQVILIPTRALP